MHLTIYNYTHKSYYISTVNLNYQFDTKKFSISKSVLFSVSGKQKYRNTKPKILMIPKTMMVYSKVRYISIVKYDLVRMNIIRYDSPAHNPEASPRLL